MPSTAEFISPSKPTRKRPVSVPAAALTDIGIHREHNEDTYACLEAHNLYLVADGMGGHLGGEVASQMAIEVVQSFFDDTMRPDATLPLEFDPSRSLQESWLAMSIEEANRQIFRRSMTTASMHGMGTTLVALLLDRAEGLAYISHVGDSRAYRIRDGRIEQLTRDHSLINDYLRIMPNMSQEAIDMLPDNVITRALGIEDTVIVDIRVEELKCGDVYLLCTDGLSGQVSDARVLELMTECDGDLPRAAELLVRESNLAGGYDNVTVVAVAID
ncbi:MAG: protein phosphatase 2C domain-containing protein [Myxococcales bacterium]|nr:protein phosphatase 2C domain-containing protein [Myxococcales bacterium]